MRLLNAFVKLFSEAFIRFRIIYAREKTDFSIDLKREREIKRINTQKGMNENIKPATDIGSHVKRISQMGNQRAQ